MSLSRISVSVFAVVLSFAGMTQAADKFAGISYSTKTGASGYSYRWDSEDEALRMAKHYANDETAEALAWVRNGYIALAVGQDRSQYGWAWSATAEEAKVLALKEAQKRTTNCYIAILVHSQQGLISSATAPPTVAKTPRVSPPAPITPPNPITPPATVVHRSSASSR